MLSWQGGESGGGTISLSCRYPEAPPTPALPLPTAPPKPMSQGPPCPHFIQGETEALSALAGQELQCRNLTGFQPAWPGAAPANKSSGLAAARGAPHRQGAARARGRLRDGLCPREAVSRTGSAAQRGPGQPRGPRAAARSRPLHRLPSVLSYRRTGFLFICRGLAQGSLQSFPFAGSLSSSSARGDPCATAQASLHHQLHPLP